MTETKKAIMMANFCAFLLVCIKVVAGIFSGSMAVLSSALDSLLDFCVSLFNLYVLKKSDRKNCDCKNYNYGQGKLQGFGAFFEGLIVLFSGVFLIYLSYQKFISYYISGAYEIKIDMSIYVMIISIFITGFLVYYLDKASKKNNNLTLKAESLHYKTDLYTNLGIIISLIIVKFTLFIVIDIIISTIIGVYIIVSSRNIIVEGFNMLMDKKIDDNEIEKIIKIIKEFENKKVKKYTSLKTRKSGDDIFIDFHLIFGKDIKLSEAHNIADELEEKIKSEIKKANILIHLEPEN